MAWQWHVLYRKARTNSDNICDNDDKKPKIKTIDKSTDLLIFIQTLNKADCRIVFFFNSYSWCYYEKLQIENHN